MSDSRAWALVVPGHSRGGRVTGRCLRLLAHAARLAQECTPRTIVFTGAPANGTVSEAEQMLEAWPGRRDVELVLEKTARTTAENAARSLPLLLSRGIVEATVICAPIHLVRVHYFFAGLYPRFGVRCEISPARCPPTPAAVAWEFGALGVMRGQRRAALAELEASALG